MHLHNIFISRHFFSGNRARVLLDNISQPTACLARPDKIVEVVLQEEEKHKEEEEEDKKQEDKKAGLRRHASYSATSLSGVSSRAEI